MKILTYPHPTLRRVSKPVRRVDKELHDMVGQMFELMYASNGIGLAANQVDLPLRLFVVNTMADPEEGEELVFINPIVSRPKGSEEKEEGCLSLPSLYATVKRPEQVHVHAYNLAGEEIKAEINGMLARVVQHELDHLDGVMFIDRLSETRLADVRDAVEQFEEDFHSRREVGEFGGDQEIAARLDEIEKRYC